MSRTCKRRCFMTSLGILSVCLFFSDYATLPFTEKTEGPYSIQDLGMNKYANGVNNRGQVVGMAKFGRDAMRAFIWTPEDGFSYLEESESIADGVSDIGEVVGHSHDLRGTKSAFLWEDGEMKPLTRDTGMESMAYDVNSVGQVVGQIGAAAGKECEAFFRDRDGELRPLGTLGGTQSQASAISESGTVVGWSKTKGDRFFTAFSWSAESGLQDLKGLGGKNSYANDVNESGMVVGQAQTKSGEIHAFASTDDGNLDLGSLGGAWSLGLGLNDRGVVVGQSEVAETRLDTFKRNSRALVGKWFRMASYGVPSSAFLWEEGEIQDLNELVDSDSGWENLTAATGINNRGQIVGFGVKEGRSHAFLLTPRDRRTETAPAGSRMVLAKSK